jgi:hypothetical protein
LAQVKKNQPKLFEALQGLAETLPPDAVANSDERNRGRDEHRHLRMWTNDKALEPVRALGWNATQTILEVRHFGTRQGKAYDEYHWHIASFQAPAEEMLAAVRLHWQVENNCHWVKDVQLDEDTTATAHHGANRTLAILRDKFSDKSLSVVSWKSCFQVGNCRRKDCVNSILFSL